MKNPFETIDERLSNIEGLLLDLKHSPKEQSESDRPLNMDEVCKLTGKSRPTIYRYVADGNIPYHKQGGRLYFFESEIVDWIKNQ